MPCGVFDQPAADDGLVRDSQGLAKPLLNLESSGASSACQYFEPGHTTQRRLQTRQAKNLHLTTAEDISKRAADKEQRRQHQSV